MTKVIGFVKPYGLTIRKKIGNPGDEELYPYAGIYQMRKCKILASNTGAGWRYKKIPIKMKFYAPTGLPSQNQLNCRDKFRLAVEAWQALTLEEREVYNGRVARLPIYGYNLFLREYLKS